jgi:hypothetical protein
VDDVGLEVAVVEVDEVKLEELDVVDDSVEDVKVEDFELDELLEELDVLELTTTTLMPPVTPALFVNAIVGLFSLI